MSLYIHGRLRRNTTLALALAALLAGGCQGDQGDAGPQGPQGPPGSAGTGGIDPSLPTFDKALAGIGGRAALENLSSYTIEASGTRLITREGFSPDDTAIEVSLFQTTVTRDLAGDNLRVDWDREILFIPGVQLAYSEIIAGDLGVVDGGDNVFGINTGDMPSTRWAAVRKQERLLNPHAILKAVAANPDGVAEIGFQIHDGAVHEVLRVNDATAPIDIFVSATTGLVSKLVTVENDHLERDVPLEIHYVGWQSFGDGLLFPSDVFIVVDGQLVHTESRNAVAVNPDIAPATFDFPAGAAPVFDPAVAEFGESSHQFHQAFASLGLPSDAPQLFVQPTELAPGVFLLAGGSHNSMAIEQANGVVIVEAPLYPERADAIIAWAADQFPGKPITHAVATHHHFDHSAGMRSFVAAGATIVISARAESLFRRVFRAPSSIVPDTLAQTPASPTILTVRDNDLQVLADAVNPVFVLHIQTFHAEDMVVVSVESGGGFVFNSDLYNPGNGGSAVFPAAAAELRAFVDGAIGGAPTLVGGHGAVAPYAELEAFVDAL